MRRITALLLTLVLLIAAVPQMSVQAAESAQTDAGSISKTSVTLTVGQRMSLKVSGVTGTVTWKSSNKSVATVSSAGTVTAKKTGTATISAKKGSKTYKCRVTVKGNYKTIYKNFLEKGTFSGTVYGQKITCQIYQFALLDINKNGVPELICCTADADGGNWMGVYSVKAGKLCQVNFDGTNGVGNIRYNSAQRALIDSYSNNYRDYRMRKMNSYRLKAYKYLATSAFGGSGEYLYGTTPKNAVHITKARFDELYKKYVSPSTWVSFCQNTPSNRSWKLG